MRPALFWSHRIVLLFTITLGCFWAKAQETGSVTGSRLVQAEFGILPFGYAGETTIEQLQALRTGDKNLNRDFSAYDKNYGAYFYNSFPAEWCAGISYFRTLQAKKGVSWSLGLKYHQVYLGGQGYSFTKAFARDTFFNSQGQGIVEYELVSDGVDFMVAAHEMLVPVSVYWSGKKQRLIWIEPGFQLFPGMIFGARYDYYESVNAARIVCPVGVKPEESYMHPSDSTVYFHKSVSLDGTGFSLNAGIPLTLYLRASKTHKVFSRIQLLANITPSLRFSYFPGTTAQQYLTTSISFGVRYCL